MQERKETFMSNTKNYPILKNSDMPVWRFYYQGDHSHPVRRVVIILRDRCTATHVTGYELREGSEVRPFSKAFIRTYDRDLIAKIGQCGRRLRKRTDQALHNRSTLVREDLVALIQKGV